MTILYVEHWARFFSLLTAHGSQLKVKETMNQILISVIPECVCRESLDPPVSAIKTSADPSVLFGGKPEDDTAC